jgi:hypothetical protein
MPGAAKPPIQTHPPPMRGVALNTVIRFFHSPRISTSPSITFLTPAGGMRASRLPMRSTDKVRI